MSSTYFNSPSFYFAVEWYVEEYSGNADERNFEEAKRIYDRYVNQEPGGEKQVNVTKKVSCWLVNALRRWGVELPAH